MLFFRRSPISGNVNKRFIPVTPEQFERWQSGTPIQVAMPNISAEDREFMLTGITPEEWAVAFADEDEDAD